MEVDVKIVTISKTGKLEAKKAEFMNTFPAYATFLTKCVDNAAEQAGFDQP